ncbi:hypothetical protein TNCV_3340031 [Trichonephila clavipes]|nr:hypothetical protein TNCV_3340031 [Trichonephila clavipes]
MIQFINNIKAKEPCNKDKYLTANELKRSTELAQLSEFKTEIDVLGKGKGVSKTQELGPYFASEAIQWKFIPPRSPNFEGLWKAGSRWAYGSRSEPPSRIIDVNGAWESRSRWCGLLKVEVGKVHPEVAE